MPRAIVYIRVSTDEQVESGAGTKGQLHTCKAFVARKGMELIGPFEEDEGLSGATPFEKCPKLMEAVATLESGDVLLVSRRDRLARDRLKIIMFEQLLKTRGCRLVSATGEGTDHDDPNDLSAFLLRGIVDLFSEYERLVIKFRTSSGMQAKRRAGARVGRVPYGFDLAGAGAGAAMLIPNRHEQGVLATMKACRERRRWTYRRIAAFLNDTLGAPTKAGKRWSHAAVRHVLLNPHPMNEACHADEDDAAPAEAGVQAVAR